MQVTIWKRVVCGQKALCGWVGSSSSKTPAIKQPAFLLLCMVIKHNHSPFISQTEPYKAHAAVLDIQECRPAGIFLLSQRTAHTTTRPRPHFFARKDHNGIHDLKYFFAKFLTVNIKAIPGLRTYRSIVFRK